jgi:hypothetical protein
LLEPKGKALSDGEIVAVWRAAQVLADRAAAGAAVSGTFGALVQLGLLTGMRRGELFAARARPPHPDRRSRG